MNDPIDQADMHPSWRDDPDPPSFFGIENASPEKWQKWVVALEFHKDGIYTLSAPCFLPVGGHVRFPKTNTPATRLS